MSEHVKEITQQEYEREVLAAKGAVVLDFYSTECPPCEALAPKYESVAEAFAGRASSRSSARATVSSRPASASPAARPSSSSRTARRWASG